MKLKIKWSSPVPFKWDEETDLVEVRFKALCEPRPCPDTVLRPSVHQSVRPQPRAGPDKFAV